MKLIVGLGNPGLKYAKTRHNAGFMAVDLLASNKIKWQKNKKAKYLFIQQQINGCKVEIIKPQTYMNDSGLSVAYAAKKLNLKPEDIIVIYDDLDLPFGRIRIRPSGSSGGHKGVQSIIDNLKFNNFIRVRIGIKNKFAEKMLAEKFVLKKFNRTEQKILEKEILPQIPQIIETILKQGIEKAMNQYNLKSPAFMRD